MKVSALLSLLVLSSACATTSSSVGGTSGDVTVAKAQFERIKSLAGEWSGTFGDAGQAVPAEIRYRVTAGGSAVEETMAPGSEYEMVTLYHLDGGRLMLTHYCAAGNQPRMVAQPAAMSGEHPTIHFDFVDATNLASPMDGHMHQAEIEFDGSNHIESRWTYFKDGKPGENARFDLVRKNVSG